MLFLDLFSSFKPISSSFKTTFAFRAQTERTMTELEIAVNQRVGEWEVIQESGTTLRPLSGPGLTGMRNLGNSCYLNSVMQVLFTVPDFESKSVPAFISLLFCFFFNSPDDKQSKLLFHIIISEF